MTKKKTPQTIEECNAELELTQKKIRQYENRSKMLDRRLAIEKRKERNHRLCSRGGYSIRAGQDDVAGFFEARCRTSLPTHTLSGFFTQEASNGRKHYTHQRT